VCVIYYYYYCHFDHHYPPTLAESPAWVERSDACVCLFVCLSVCALKGKQLELSTPILVHVYSACIDPEVKGQGHTVQKPSRRTVASADNHQGWNLGCWVCMSIWLAMFASCNLHVSDCWHCCNDQLWSEYYAVIWLWLSAVLLLSMLLWLSGDGLPDVKEDRSSWPGNKECPCDWWWPSPYEDQWLWLVKSTRQRTWLLRV